MTWPTSIPKGTRIGSQIRLAQIVAAGLELAVDGGFNAVHAAAVARRASCSTGLVRAYGGRRMELWKLVAQRALITGEYTVIAEARRLGLYPK